MEENSKIKRFRQIANDLADLYKQKNTAYGDSFGKSVQKYGNVAALTRLSDKFNRMENLVLHPETNCDDERLMDTLRDMASYCIMFAMELEEQRPDEEQSQAFTEKEKKEIENYIREHFISDWNYVNICTIPGHIMSYQGHRVAAIIPSSGNTELLICYDDGEFTVIDISNREISGWVI